MIDWGWVAIFILGCLAFYGIIYWYVEWAIEDYEKKKDAKWIRKQRPRLMKDI